MRFLLLNHIENARESLRSNRLRTSLTVLGITLGVACITTVLSLGAGATHLIENQVKELGGNIAVIRPGGERPLRSLRDIVTPMGPESFTASSLTESDYSAIKELDGVKAAAPLMSVSGTVKSKDQTIPSTPIVATTPELATISNLKIEQGQFIDAITNKNTVVIGRQLSMNLFGTYQSVGQTMRIKGQVFTVIGVLKAVDDSVNYNNLNINDAAIISLDSGKLFNQNIAQIRQINVQATDSATLTGLVSRMQEKISEKHLGEKDFSILTGDAIARPTSQLFDAVARTSFVISVVALIIGGIGIMNIMLVSVAERTREIGIRKAVGASNTHISMQFLIESLVMSLAGGIIGYLIGYATAFLLGLFLPFTPVVTWQIALLAFGLSVAVGTLFGLYPAIRAARKNPIEALRQYY